MSSGAIINRAIKHARENKVFWLVGLFAFFNPLTHRIAEEESENTTGLLADSGELVLGIAAITLILFLLATVIAHLMLIQAANSKIEDQDISLKRSFLASKNLWFPVLFIIGFSQLLAFAFYWIVTYPVQYFIPIIRDSSLVTTFYFGLAESIHAAFALLWLNSFVLEDKGIFRSFKRTATLAFTRIDNLSSFFIAINLALYIIITLIVNIGFVFYFILAEFLSNRTLITLGVVASPFLAAAIGFIFTVYIFAWTGLFKKITADNNNAFIN